MFQSSSRPTLALLCTLLLATLIFSGCSSNPKSELEDPAVIMQKAHDAYASKDYQQVYQLVFPLAAAGNDQAQYTLGYLYFHGLGTAKDERQAMNWIQRAAAQGNRKAQHALK